LTDEPEFTQPEPGDDDAIMPADEVRGLWESVHLLRSPRNAARLLKALCRARQRRLKPETVDALREEMGPGDTA
jgi:antitoxin YefM